MERPDSSHDAWRRHLVGLVPEGSPALVAATPGARFLADPDARWRRLATMAALTAGGRRLTATRSDRT
jgi:hypothetical protein